MGYTKSHNIWGNSREKSEVWMCTCEPCEDTWNGLKFAPKRSQAPGGHFDHPLPNNDFTFKWFYMTCTHEGALSTCWGPACSHFMDSMHVPSLLYCMIGGLLYTVQMFSCAISWLFFKWPLSQGMAGQHMETSALTIFLSKQQMALLLSFWSGAKIPMAEVLVYIDAAGEGQPAALPPPTVALPTDVFSATPNFSLFLPVTLLLQGVMNFDSSSCDCCLIASLISHGPQVASHLSLLGFH